MINNVSFGSNLYGKTQSVQSFKANNYNKSCNFDDFQYDSYVSTEKTPANKKAKSQNSSRLTPFQKIGLAVGIPSVALGALGGAGVVAGVNAVQENSQKSPEPAAYYGEITDADQLEYIANLYNSDAETVIALNGGTLEAVLDRSEITIPKAVDTFAERKEEIQKELFNEDLSDDERANLMDEVDYISEKQKQQEETAIAYHDDKYVYFQMKKTVNAEEFKNIYGIEDGALRKYNDLDYDFYTVANGFGEPDSHFKDYTFATLQEGETYKVRAKDLDSSLIKFVPAEEVQD